jgi:BolA protein
MNRVTQIQYLLENALQPTQLIIHDDSDDHIGHSGHGGAGHFRIEIAARAFNGMSTIERHRTIYKILAPMMPGEIHALSIKAEGSN